MFRHPAAAAFALRIVFLLALFEFGRAARAVVLWSDLGATLVHQSGEGSDVLGGAVRRDDSSSDTLYFKFHVDPLSDVSTEEYFAGFQFYEGADERLGIGNSLKAWAYSAFYTAESGVDNKVFGDVDLRSLRPESSGPGTFLSYELPRRGIECTIVLKVRYVPGGDDLVTVWLNPDLAPGAVEEEQPEGLSTRFRADASFTQIRLRHGGGGGGWTFSDMAIATAFDDFVHGNRADPRERTARGVVPITFRAWTREQGLPQNSVRALAQTRDGYLWIGSDAGLARFDGVRFVPFDIREGLRSGPVRVLFEDSSGNLWIGTSGGGLTRFQNGHFSSFTMADGLPSDDIISLAEDREGRLWIGTASGLALWVSGNFAPFPAATNLKGKAVTALFRDRSGTMWLGARGAGVFMFSQGKLENIRDPAVDSLLQDPHCLLVDQAERLWIGAGDDYVLSREADQWRRHRIPRHLVRPHVSALAEEPDGTVWAGSVSEGLFQFRDGELSALDASSGLLDNFVESLLVDREGNLWVGTGAGLNRLRRSELSVLGQNEGLGYGPVHGLAEIEPGVILAGKPDGVYRWDRRNFSRLAIGGMGQRVSRVNSLLATRDGGCWVAGAFGLMFFSDAKRMEQEPVLALAGLNVLSLCEDRNGGTWAGTQEGTLWFLRDGNWTARASRPHAITAIASGPGGVIWIGTEGDGVHRMGPGEALKLDRSSGLVSDLIRALWVDEQGTLWIGTAGGGLSRWHNGRLTSFTTREGFPDNTISQILDDGAGRLWLGSNRGIISVRKQELENHASGKSSVLYPQLFGRAEGMPSEECTGGFFPAGLRTRSGLLWFSTLKGIVAVNANPGNSLPAPPVVMIEEVLLEGVPAAELRGARNETVTIPPGRHRLELRYTGINFSAPDRVRFRYRMERLDSDWVEAGPQRTAAYNYIPPGDYRFRVIACNADGSWNEEGAILAFRVLPHFWQTWWFISGAGIVLLVSVGGTVRLVEKSRLNRRLKLLEQERAVERERARIAQDLHDDLGSSLARISLLSGLVKSDKEHPLQVETHANKISQSADQTTRALEEIVWAVRPGSDSLQSLVDYISHFANELFESDAARCRLDLPGDLPARSLPPDLRHNIFLVVKEALTNALKHAGAREVRVHAKISGNRFEVFVQDDGKGFDSTLPAREGRRHGLGNMRRRAESIGGKLTCESAPGKGTIVTLAVDLPDTGGLSGVPGRSA